MSEPFRSRPRIRPQQAPPPEPEDQVIDGVITEDIEQSLVPYSEPEPAQAEPRHRPQRPRVKRTRLVHVDLFMLALMLLVGGIFFTLMNVTTLADAILQWWPAASLGAAVLWSFMALVRRDATAFLGGAGIAGLSVSLLLDSNDVAPFGESVVGVILISLGVAIVVRGLLLRSTEAV